MSNASEIAQRQILAAMPKVDLHRHLEGSLRLSSLQAIARASHFGLADDLEHLQRMVQVAPDQPRTALNFLSKFEALRRFYQSPEVIARLTTEAVADAAADRVRYLELRFTPNALATAQGFGLEDVTDWVVAAARKAAEVHEIGVRLILSVNRHEGVAIAERVVHIAADRRDAGVVGVDLAGDELHFASAPFAGLFRDAKRAGLGVTVHAGEWAGPEAVREAIEAFQADRIGHGVRVVDDPSVASLASERDVAFEVCLTSNVQTGAVSHMALHPARRMIELGLAVTFNSDDPGISNILLTDEYLAVLESLGLSVTELQDTLVTAARHAFLPEMERAGLAKRLRGELGGE